jgi:hypothetical protein
MKPPLPKMVRVVVLVCATLLVPAAIGLIVTDASPWPLLAMMPSFFLAGYVTRDIDVR